MRIALAITIVLAFLLSPLATAGLLPACDQPPAPASAMAGAAASTDMAGMVMPATAAPSQDHGDRRVKHSDSRCAQACAANLSIALDNAPFSVSLTLANVEIRPAAGVAVHDHRPSVLERPPKPIA